MNEKIKAFAAVSAAVLALNGAVSAAPTDSHVTNVNAASRMLTRKKRITIFASGMRWSGVLIL